MKALTAHECCVCGTVTTDEPRQWLAVDITATPAFVDGGPQRNEENRDLVCGAYCAIRLASEIVNRALGEKKS